MNVIFDGEQRLYEEFGRQYVVNTVNWSCTCVLSVEYLLPRAHSLHAFVDAGNNVGKPQCYYLIYELEIDLVHGLNNSIVSCVYKCM